MRKTKKFLITAILFFVAFSSIADIGYCFKYKVRFELKDKSEITGFYLFPTYDYYFKNISSFDTILSFSSNSWTDSILIYKQIETIERIRIDDKYFSIDVIPEKSPTKLCLKNIIRTTIIECNPCCENKTANGVENSYIGCCIAVVRELSDKEIEKLKSQEPILSLIYHDCPDEGMNSLVVLSYNKDLRKNDLLEKIKENYCQKANSLNGDYFKKYNSFKDWTRNEDIIVFKHCWW